MANNPSHMAVLNIDKGEEILAGYVTAAIPQVGKYKLLVKRKVDGTIDWAHFVERDTGLKEKVIRGNVKSLEELDIVLSAINNNLRKVFGVAMQAAEYEVRTLDGKKVSETMH
jgi:hypothetical protein